MSNFLERFRGNNPAPIDIGTTRFKEREQVLTSLAEQREFEVRQNTPVSPLPQTDAREFFDQRCVCAIEDLEFIVRYVRQPSGLFRATESIKPPQGQQSGEASVPSSLVVPINQIEGSHTPCPFCGNSGHYHCNCGGVVCGGRVLGQLFTCRKSCGDKWIIGTPVTEIKGSKPRQEPQESKAPPRRPSSSAAPPKPASSENRLLLGSGNTPAVKGRK
jgi:hypothetical protein